MAGLQQLFATAAQAASNPPDFDHGSAPSRKNERNQELLDNEYLNREMFQPKAGPADKAFSDEMNKGGVPFDKIEEHWLRSKTPRSLDD